MFTRFVYSLTAPPGPGHWCHYSSRLNSPWSRSLTGASTSPWTPLQWSSQFMEFVATSWSDWGSSWWSCQSCGRSPAACPPHNRTLLMLSLSRSTWGQERGFNYSDLFEIFEIFIVLYIEYLNIWFSWLALQTKMNYKNSIWFSRRAV